MAKWGTYPPDEQLRLKRNAAEELYEALFTALSILVEHGLADGAIGDDCFAALRKARGEAA